MFENAPMELIVIIMAGTAVLAMAYTIWRGFVYKDPYEARLKAMAERRSTYKAAALGVVSTPDNATGLMRSLAKKIGKRSARKKSGSNLRVLLARAGIRQSDAPEYYMLIRLVLPFVFGGLAALYVTTSTRLHLSPAMMLLICGGAVAIGYMSPNLWAKNRITKRQKLMRKQLPDALDLLVVCTEAGLALNAALDRVVREMTRSAGTIADELGLLLIELNFLDERKKAFANLCERTDMEEFRSIANTLQQAEKYGTPLAQAMRVLAQDFRGQRLARAEEKAARLPALLTVPMIFFILPCVFIVLLGPAILKALAVFNKG